MIDEKDKKYSKYSLGMKQKLAIAQAIMEDPSILILDEPFNGIEEKSVEKITKFLKEEAKNGKTIIFSTHIKEDLENQGFKMKNINIEYTNNKVDYGEPIYLKIFYKYELKIPLASSKLIDMQVERNSVCKR